MSGGRPPFAEVDTDVSLVRRLLAGQFPQWADLRIEHVHSSGTDNAIYRLGEDMAVRLPLRTGSVPQVEKEEKWLPRFAPLLPLAIPVPLAKGVPGEGYPWYWSVTPWLKGENATVQYVADQSEAATQMAQFIGVLQRFDPTGGPPPGSQNYNRGEPLANRDDSTRRDIASLPDTFDKDAVTEAWEASLRTPLWDGPPTWIHGDLHPANLLVEDGRLSAVIDFGCLAVGDPACDLMVAWNLLDAEGRDVFRAYLPVDDATWVRGRGWALSFSVGAVVFYAKSNPPMARVARRTIAGILAD